MKKDVWTEEQMDSALYAALDIVVNNESRPIAVGACATVTGTSFTEADYRVRNFQVILTGEGWTKNRKGPAKSFYDHVQKRAMLGVSVNNMVQMHA